MKFELATLVAAIVVSSDSLEKMPRIAGSIRSDIQSSKSDAN